MSIIDDVMTDKITLHGLDFVQVQLEGGQRLGLVVLGEGPAHAAVPLVPLRTGAAGTSLIERGPYTLSG